MASMSNTRYDHGVTKQRKVRVKCEGCGLRDGDRTVVLRGGGEAQVCSVCVAGARR